MNTEIRSGDFTNLAKDYSQSRPDYSPSVLSGLIGLMGRPSNTLDFVDVGAGTGIWTRMIAAHGVNSLTAVEPNEDMRIQGMADSAGQRIKWVAGSAENTGLPNACCDWLSMASSFHWAHFENATTEFHRLLRPGGRFVSLWNPRLIEVNPILVEIESHLRALHPDIKRVSSGRSGITETLSDRLWASPYFEDIVYLEGRHLILMSTERYLSAWRSVNDLRVQLGASKFEAFLRFVENHIRDSKTIEATYLTRAWSALRKS